MANLNNVDNSRLIIDGVNDSIVALTDTIRLGLPASFSGTDGRGRVASDLILSINRVSVVLSDIACSTLPADGLIERLYSATIS